MILTRIALRNFRTYESLDLEVSPGLTLIVGGNGEGKTNLAEAIHYLSLGRSWRTQDDRLLLRKGSDSAHIEATVVEGPLKKEISIEILKTGKRILINGNPCRRLSEFSGLVNVIVFSPKDVPLFQEGPGERRSFLDESISKRSGEYLSLLMKYNRLLKERNALLKEENPNPETLNALTELLARTAEPLILSREEYVSLLNGVLPGLLSSLNGSPCEPRLTYRPFVRPGPEFVERALKAFEDARESDLSHRSTTVGVQREDISMSLNGIDLGDYGSQGQNRLCALALKLAPYLLIQEEAKKPIVVLDDVASELDETRVRNLLSVLKGFGQVFVTATKLDIEGASYVDVAANTAIRRN